MAYRELELTLLSAQDLKSVNLITRMDVYAVVSISNDPLTRQSTEPDTYGGRNPCWNATFRFAVPPTSAAAAASNASLHVLLRAERFLGDRDVGEVVVPLSDVLAGAKGPGPQPPQVATYQVRKLHRWEPRGVLHVAYRLGPVVAPVVERAPSEKVVYAPVAAPPPPLSQQYPTAVAYYSAPPPAPGRPAPAGRVVAEHDEAVQNKSSPVRGYPVGVPQQQQVPHPPAKPDAYHPPSSPSPPPPSRRPAAVYAASNEEARRPPIPPAPAPAPPPTNGGSNDGLSQPGPTHFYLGPNSQIFFGGASSSLPTRTTSPARSVISPAGKGDGNWAFVPHNTQGNWASAAESMSMSVISPRSRKEDPLRPSVLSQSQHDTQQLRQQQQQTASSPVAATSPHRLAASPFSSRSSSFSSPLSPYSSAHPSPSPSTHSSTRSPYHYSAHPSTATSPYQPSSSSAHSSTHSPYQHSAHPSAATSPYQPLRSSGVSNGAEVTHGTNNTFRSTSSRGEAIASPSPLSSPMVQNHSRGATISSPLPSSSPMLLKHSSVVPSL